MSGAIPPLPQYALMAWYSVKAQGQLYLYLYNIQEYDFNPEDRNVVCGCWDLCPTFVIAKDIYTYN
jgi:hypothetical protein